MRILHIVTAFPRWEDDVITPWLVELLQHLRAAGHEVEVLTSAYRGGGNREFRGIPVHRFRYFPGRWEDLTHDEAVPERLKRGRRYWAAVPCYLAAGCWASWRLCRRRRFEVVQVHWPVPHVVFGWVARAASGARLVTTFYGVEVRWITHRLRWLRWLLARAVYWSDQVVAISRFTATELRKLAPVEVAVIPYGPGLGGTGGPDSLCGPWGAAEGHEPAGGGALAEAGVRVLFVGRLVARKGVPVLIEAARRLRVRLPLRVTVVGEGPERPQLEALVREAGLEDVVRLAGRISTAALREAYREADVLVLPAVEDERGDTEGLGVVLLEAMALGTPVIASDIGGITDIVEAERTGLLVPPGDPAALAGAIERLARDPALRQRLAAAGRQRFEEQFSWPAITRRWEALYRRLVSARAAAG